MSTSFVMASDNGPYFIPNQQQPTVSPIVLVPHRTTSTSVNSNDVNNLIMSSQQKLQSLMTSDELNRKVDQQIQQHSLLLGEQQPSTSLNRSVSPPPMTVPLPHSHSDSYLRSHPHEYYHHCSHSINSSPNPSGIKKKNVCFKDVSTNRRYSVDDLDISRQSIPLKSCLKSSTTTIKDEKQLSTDINHDVQTQTMPTNQNPRPKSAVVSNNAYQTSSVPASIELWHTRQLKSVPSKKKNRKVDFYSNLINNIFIAFPTSNSQSSTTNEYRRKNLSHLYEKVCED